MFVAKKLTEGSHPPDPPVVSDGTIAGHALDHGGTKDTSRVDAGPSEGKEHHVYGGHGDAHEVDGRVLLVDLVPNEEHEKSSHKFEEKSVAGLEVCVERSRAEGKGVGAKRCPDERRGENTAEELADPQPEHAHERDVAVEPAIEADRWVHIAAHSIMKGCPGHAKGKGDRPEL